MTSRALACSLLLAIFVFGSNKNAVADDYIIDPGHTSIHFRVGHFQFSQMQGSFNRISGTFSFDPEKPEASEVRVEVDVGSIDTNNKARDDHMRDPSYFNVARFPTAVFQSTKIVMTGKRTGLIMGSLSILGVTIPVTLETTFNGLAPHPFGKKFEKFRNIVVAGFSARTKINRHDFGMSNGRGEKGDIAELTIEVEGWKK